jgi:hypothetical protein
MTKRIYVDRSRYEQYGRCPRSRYLQYSFGGVGIESSRKPLPLAVGGSVHKGLATLLREGQAAIDKWGSVAAIQRDTWMNIEEAAVRDAVADFREYQNALDLGDELKLPEGFARTEVDEYLFQEQSALVEAMIRAYSRRRLLPLLEQFEVLEVEREGEWMLSQWTGGVCECGHYRSDHLVSMMRMTSAMAVAKLVKIGLPTTCSLCACQDYESNVRELWFMSRPDALLRERESNQLYLESFKTAASWDIRKARDAEHDMQGMSEGIEIERRLGEWWAALQPDETGGRARAWVMGEGASDAMIKYLVSLDAPPRILAVRYEYMLKGERWKDKELSERFGVEMRSQKSHLVRAYEAVSVPMRGSAGYNIGDRCWSWDYIRDDGKESSLAWQNWKSRAVDNVREWIDKLDDAAPAMSGEDATMGLEPRMLGYKCDAQSLGVTREHPLDAIFIPPIIVYRNEDELRDLIDQMESQERRIAEGVVAVSSAADAGEVRHALNIHFPQTRRACEYPTTCVYSKICYGGEDIREDPCGSGMYKIRVANHPQENQP